MRIFKNRGDIYFSKSNKKKSNEQKILIVALVAIVAFTIVFLSALAIKNDFSAKKFFAPEELEITTEPEEEQLVLPEVSGKTNYVSLVCKGNELLFVELVQVDMDNVSCKVSALKAETVVDGASLAQLYKKSGSENVKKAVESLMGEEFDFYIDMQSDKFAEFFGDMGEVYYPIAGDIIYKSGNKAVNYSVKVKAGEQRLGGTQIINLVRYYLDSGNSSAANDLLLNSLLQQLNSTNLEKKEELFGRFVALADTNITVRNLSLADDKLFVLANDNSSVGAYSAIAEYDGDKITSESLQRVKGYFAK